MSAKILAFDPSRKVPLGRYIPLAMRARILYMPHPPAGNSDACEGHVNLTTLAYSVKRPSQCTPEELANSEADAGLHAVPRSAIAWGSFPPSGESKP